jgi:hypothetical protein
MSEIDLTINYGGEDMTVFDIMQRYHNDGSCEAVIRRALVQLAQPYAALARAKREGIQEAIEIVKPHCGACPGHVQMRMLDALESATKRQSKQEK